MASLNLEKIESDAKAALAVEPAMQITLDLVAYIRELETSLFSIVPEAMVMTDYFKDFPYEEIRKADGNYFDRPSQAMALGYTLSQIWSVVESDGSYTYGPSHHIVNVLGFIATKEHHNSKTYYHEEDDNEVAR